jgi:hypothetical protein
MVSPEYSADDPGATQDATSAPASPAVPAVSRAQLPVYRPRRYGARAVGVAVLAAVIAAVIVWLVMAVIL